MVSESIQTLPAVVVEAIMGLERYQRAIHRLSDPIVKLLGADLSIQFNMIELYVAYRNWNLDYEDAYLKYLHGDSILDVCQKLNLSIGYFTYLILYN